MNQAILYSTIMLIAGLGIPVMAALNGSLGNKLDNPTVAVVILFAVGLLSSVIYTLLTQGIPERLFHMEISRYYYTGGLFVAFYVLSITWVSPRFGVANAISFVLLGQMIAMSIIDHYALFGAERFQLDIKRCIGLLFMAIGVILIVKKV